MFIFMIIRRIIIAIVIMRILIDVIIYHMIFIRGKMLFLISISCLGSVVIDVVNHNFLVFFFFLISISMIRGNMLLLIYISCLGSVVIDVVNHDFLD